MVAENPSATAVAVRRDRFVAVGSMDDLKPWMDAYPYEIDTRFQDKFLFPGLIDPHMHPMLGAIQFKTFWLSPEAWELHDETVEATITPEEIHRKLKAELARQKAEGATDMFFGRGWSRHFHGNLTRADLDELAPDRPVAMLQRSMHEIVLNTAALNFLGLTAEDFGDDPQANWTDGHFIEGALFDVVVPPLDPILFGPDFIDPGYERNYSDVNAPVRITLHPDAYKMIAQKGGFDEAFDFIDGQLTGGDLPHPVLGGKRIKLFADGAVFASLMVMNEPGYVGYGQNEWITPQESFRAPAAKYWKAGYRVHVHVTGDGGADITLDVFEALQEEPPRLPNSLVLEHYGYANERIIRRVAELGAAVSGPLFYVTTLGDLYSEVSLGPDRARKMVPLRGLVDRGVVVGLHSDLGMAPAGPLYLAWAAITRETLQGKLMNPDRGLTLHKAMRAITIDVAHILGLEKDIGTVEAGKLADLSVMDKDPYEVGVEGLRGIDIWGVVFEGRVVPSNPEAPSISRKTVLCAAHIEPAQSGPLKAGALTANCFPTEPSPKCAS
jgi:predicted amidohydrolase YtcJ